MGTTPFFFLFPNTLKTKNSYLLNQSTHSFVITMVFDSPTKNPAINAPLFCFAFAFFPINQTASIRTILFLLVKQTDTLPSMYFPFPSSNFVFMPYSHSPASPAPSQSLLSHLAFAVQEAAASLYLPAQWWQNYSKVEFPHGSHGYGYYCGYGDTVIDHVLCHVPYFGLFSAHRHPFHFPAPLAAINIIVNRKKYIFHDRTSVMYLLMFSRSKNCQWCPYLSFYLVGGVGNQKFGNPFFPKFGEFGELWIE